MFLLFSSPHRHLMLTLNFQSVVLWSQKLSFSCLMSHPRQGGWCCRYKIFLICNWKTTSPGNNSFTEKENVQWHWQQYWDAHNKSDQFWNTFIFTSPGRMSNHRLVMQILLCMCVLEIVMCGMWVKWIISDWWFMVSKIKHIICKYRFKWLWQSCWWGEAYMQVLLLYNGLMFQRSQFLTNSQSQIQENE